MSELIIANKSDLVDIADSIRTNINTTDISLWLLAMVQQLYKNIKLN